MQRRGGLLARRRGRGDREAEHAALYERALDPDAPAVRLDDALGDREPEPRAEAPRVLRRLPERVEHMGQVFRSNPGSGVAHLEDDLSPTFAGAHRHATS